MLIQKKLIKDMDRAAYNPRVDLRPGDDEYEALKDSLTEFGLVIPIIWNQRTNRVVGGHQRLTVEEDLGHTEVYVSVVDLDEIQEKQLNIALNKAQGAWDDGKLAELMDSLGGRAQDTGFTLPEIEALTSRMQKNVGTEYFNDSFAHGDYQFIFDRKILGRTDWYAYTGDEFGTTQGSTFSNRRAASAHFDALNRRYCSSNETMFRKSVSLSDMTEIRCNSPRKKQELIDSLHSRGITEINGIKLEQFIKVGGGEL